MHQLRPELENVLQSLSLNGYSIFSLIDDILTRRDWEDERIKILREGMERDAADICVRLLSYITSGPEGVLKFGRVQSKNHSHTVSIDILPDNVFLDIFNFCIDDHTVFPILHARSWQTLVHVCKRWRGIIFASPRRLDLHLNCSYGTPVRKNLLFWPVTLPLIVNYSSKDDLISPEDEDNIVAALEQPSRVHRIMILGDTPLMKKVRIALRKSFPALGHLDLDSPDYSTTPVIPRRFLGGSAPHLQHVRLNCMSFPQLRRLSSSARNIVTLRLENISRTPEVSPDDMVRSLAMLTRLTTLSISFDEELPDQWTSHPDAPTLAIFPVLTHFNYVGWHEYLEVFLARIKAPQVSFVVIEYFIHENNQVSQLSQFIERTENLKIDQFACARVFFYAEESRFELNCPRGPAFLSLTISGFTVSEIQLRVMADVLDGFTTTLSKVDDLFVRGDLATTGTAIHRWEPYFGLFPAVKTLRLSGGVAVLITSALEGTPEEMAANVWSALRLIWLIECEDEEEGEDEDDWKQQVGPMERFLSLRQRFGCPVTILDMDNEVVKAEQRQ